MTQQSVFTLERIAIRGANVPDPSSGSLTRGPGYTVYSQRRSDAAIILGCTLSQRGNDVVVPRLRGITIWEDKNNGRTYRLRLTGPVVNAALIRISQAPSNSQIVQILEPFAGIVSLLRVVPTRQYAPIANPASHIRLAKVEVWSEDLPEHVSLWTHSFAGVKLDLHNTDDSRVYLFVRLPRRKQLLGSSPHYDAYYDGIVNNVWCVRLKGGVATRVLASIATATSPGHVWAKLDPVCRQIVSSLRVANG